MTDAAVDDRLEDHPPSVVLVYKVLEYEGGELTQSEIADHSCRPIRTIRRSLAILEDDGLVESRTVYTDARRKVYRTVK